MNFNDPVFGVLIMMLGIIIGLVIILRDLLFKKK